MFSVAFWSRVALSEPAGTVAESRDVDFLLSENVVTTSFEDVPATQKFAWARRRPFSAAPAAAGVTQLPREAIIGHSFTVGSQI